MQLFIPRYRSLIKDILPVLLVYLYLFQPPVLITKYIYIGVEFILFLVLILFNRKFLAQLLGGFRQEFILLVFIVLYALVRDGLVGEEVLSFRFLAWSFQAFIFGFALIVLFKFNIDRMFVAFYWASVLAACISLMLVMFPSVDIMYKLVQLDTVPIYEKMEVRHRSYGISENLTFTYSYVLGFFAGYTLLILDKNKFLLIPCLLLLLGVSYNARIGFVAIILFLIYLLLRFRIKGLMVFVVLSVLLLLTLNSLFPDILDKVFFNKGWVFDFFYDLSDFFIGTNHVENSTLDTLTGDFLIFPETFPAWIFGTGEFLFEKKGMNSDIGYIIQLYYGGLLFILLLFLLNIVFCFRLVKLNGIMHWFTFVFIASVLILNFKGFVFAATPGGRMLFLFYMCFVLLGRKNEINKILQKSTQ